MKTQLFTALALVLTIGALPGCGKSANNTDGGVNGIYGSLIGATINGSTACIVANTNSQVSFPISGAAQLGVSGFSAQTNVGGAGFSPSGNYYTRTNATGDVINLILAGSPNSTGTITGTVTLSPMTVSTIMAYSYGAGSACIQGVVFNNTGVTAGSPGQLYGGMYLVINGGYLPL